MKRSLNLLVQLVIIITAVLALSSCSTKRAATGSEDKILVLADSTDWVILEDTLRSVFEQTRMTPQPEKVFNLQKVSPDDLAKVKQWKNILLVGTLQSTGAIKELLSGALSTEARKRVEQDSAFIFAQKNSWALNQLLMVLVARDMEALRQKLTMNKAQLFHTFDTHVTEVVRNEMYRLKEQKTINKTLQQKYGWHVRVQHDYFIAAEDDTNQVIWLRRFGMGESGSQRWLLVHWIDTDNPSLIEESQWVVDLRNQLTRKYYNGDIIRPEFTRSEIVNFNGRRAMQVDGLWENNTYMVGGPFRSYTFFEQSQNRIYLIDLAVLAPGEKKLPFLRQLDIMAHTFATND